MKIREGKGEWARLKKRGGEGKGKKVRPPNDLLN